MLKPKNVSRAVILGNKNYLERTVDILHDLQSVHIEDFNEEDSFLSIGKPGEIATEASHKLIKLRSLSNFLGIKSGLPGNLMDEKSLLKELDSKLEALDSAVADLMEKRSSRDAELKELENTIKGLKPISGLELQVELYTGYDSLSVFAGHAHGDPAEIEASIKEITPDYEILFSSENRSQILALFVKHDYSEQALEVLENYGFSEIRIPEVTGDPVKLLIGLDNRKQEILNELESLTDMIGSMRNQYMDFILASDEILSITTQKAEAPLRFAMSEKTFIIDCWIADEKFHLIDSAIEDNFKGSVFISKLDMVEEGIKYNSVPVEYDNPELVKPLEALMDLYSRPLYKELDPSAIIFITFPLFYGLMLGDIGYALVLVTLSLIARSKLKSPGFKTLSTLLMYCSISALIFGILFAELFGFHVFGHHSIIAELLGEHSALGQLFYDFEALPVLERLDEEDIPVLLLITAIIGLVHLNIGFLLGFRNEAKLHGIKTAFMEKISWIMIEIGIGLAALSVLNFIPSIGQILGAFVAVAGLLMLIAAEGGAAVVELPSLLSNTLSYTRLAAVGLSSVGIAFAVNNIVTEMLFPKGGLFLVLGIIVLLIGHIINTILGVVAPGLHALRLQYVEFFTKFYHGGGIKFNPYGYVRKYTEVQK